MFESIKEMENSDDCSDTVERLAAMEEEKFTEDWEVMTSNGWQDFKGIRKTRKDSLRISFTDGTSIECSRRHKFYEGGKFIYAFSVIPGDVLSGRQVANVGWAGEQDLYDLLEVDGGHHYTASGIEVSNCAFIAKNKWDDFFKSTFPTISSGTTTKLLIVSTPSGKNHFYDLWTRAQTGQSEMHPIEVNWWDVPGRDEKWHQEMLRTMTEEQFEVEYGNSFDVESSALIPKSVMRRLRDGIKEPAESSPTMKIYETPSAGRSYVCSVDVSAGVGKDASVVSILDVTEGTFKLAAIFASNSIDYYSLPTLIFTLAKKYNEAKVLVESNDIGSTVLRMLNYELEYDNVVKTYVGNSGRPILGQRTTTKTKIVGCATLKEMCANGRIEIPDVQTLVELEHFQLVGTSYEAAPGYHDDRVMSLVNFCYYTTTRNFQNEFDRSVMSEFREASEKTVMESLQPIPLFSGNNWGDDESRENLRWLQ